MPDHRNERVEPWWCNWNQFRPFPHMALEHAEAIRRTILSVEHASILEWGSGGSTLWLALVAKGAVIYSVEHDPAWRDKVRSAYGAIIACFDVASIGVTIVLETNLADYRNPNKGEFERSKADVAIVDGLSHWRPDCLLACRDLVKPGGHIFLHDSQREEYSYAKTAFLECEGTSLASEVTDDLGVSLWHARR